MHLTGLLGGFPLIDNRHLVCALGYFLVVKAQV